MRVFCIAAAAVTALSISAPSYAAERDYLTVVRTVDVSQSADKVWKQIGDFCFISKMIDIPCSIESGKGDVGTVRLLNNGAIVEAMVARTPYSYTYSQPVGSRANTDYHGTLAVEAAGKNKSKISYTLVIDRARLPANTNMAEYQKALEDRFQGAIAKAKSIVEGQK